MTDSSLPPAVNPSCRLRRLPRHLITAADVQVHVVVKQTAPDCFAQAITWESSMNSARESDIPTMELHAQPSRSMGYTLDLSRS